jgi:hypothetical protein
MAPAFRVIATLAVGAAATAVMLSILADRRLRKRAFTHLVCAMCRFVFHGHLPNPIPDLISDSRNDVWGPKATGTLLLPFAFSAVKAESVKAESSVKASNKCRGRVYRVGIVRISGVIRIIRAAVVRIAAVIGVAVVIGIGAAVIGIHGLRPSTRTCSLAWIFKGRFERTGCHKKCDTLRKRGPYLRMNRFQGLFYLTRKDNSCQGPNRRIRARLRCRCGDCSPIPCLGSGILTRFPFEVALQLKTFTSFHPPLRAD